VQALSDSAPPPPERLRATMELQRQIAGLTQQVQDLGQTLTQWAKASTELSAGQRRQVLDLAALMEPIPERLAAIEKRQQDQDERLSRLEAGLSRVTAALPPLQSKDGRQVQPRLASSQQMLDLPAKVWEAKPPMFGRS
jgi:hypothetical protein